MKDVLIVTSYLLALVMYPATRTLYYAINFVTSVMMAFYTVIISINSIVLEFSDVTYNALKSFSK